MHFNYGTYWECLLRREEKEAQVSSDEECPEQNYVGHNNQLMKEKKNRKYFQLERDFIITGGFR